MKEKEKKEDQKDKTRSAPKKKDTKNAQPTRNEDMKTPERKSRR